MLSFVFAAFSLLWAHGQLAYAQHTTTDTVGSNQHATTSKTALQTSIVQATRVQPGYSTMTSYQSASASPSNYSGNAMTTFSLSEGGMIAIIVIVAVVAIIGIGSTVLFVTAKRRQWKVRDSIKRMSRRLTGRGAASNRGDADGQRKRSAMSFAPKESATTNPTRNKNALAVKVEDVERGSSEDSMPHTAKTKGTVNWAQRLSRNDWR